jgi:pSer/pThr/pTyr-binding forkhead associated (FHA) protein
VNTVILHDPKVSRHHATLRFEAGKYTIEDNGSLNGTYIYGRKITRAVLALETPIHMGNSTLLFTRKNLHELGTEFIESIGEALLVKHKSKEAVMAEILQDLEAVKAKQSSVGKNVLGKLLHIADKSSEAQVKKKGLGFTHPPKHKSC